MRNQIIALWKLLDDIDTLDDACKSDDAIFRKRVCEIQRKRFEIVSGEELDALATPSAPVSAPAGEVAVEQAAIRIIRNRAADGPSADRAVAHARQFDTDVWRDAKRDARAALSSSATPEPVSGIALRDALTGLYNHTDDPRLIAEIRKVVETFLSSPEPVSALAGEVVELSRWLREFAKTQSSSIDRGLLNSAATALSNPTPTGHVEIAHDGFAGDIIGHYVTREGKRGVVVQQDATRVVHVYGEKWIKP